MLLHLASYVDLKLKVKYFKLCAEKIIIIVCIEKVESVFPMLW